MSRMMRKHRMNDELMPERPDRGGDLYFGPDGISIPSPGEPDSGAKNFFWCCAGTAVAAVGIGAAIWLAGRDD